MHTLQRCFVSLSLLSAACTDGELGRRPDVAARDSSGVRIVESRGPDRPMALALVWRADLVPPDSALTPIPWGVAADPRTGRIYAADATAPRLAVFDADGRYVGGYGREGDGPGEFRDATALALDGEGVLAVWDARRGVLSRWSPEGTFLGEDPVPVSYWGQGVSIGGSGVMVVTSEQTGLSMAQRLVVATAEGHRTIHELPVEFGMMRLPGIEMPAPKIFMPSVVWTARGDTLWVLHGPEYRIDRYESGVPVASARRPIEPVRATPEMAAASLEQRGREFVGFMSRTGLTAEQIVNAVGYEEVVSPVQSLVMDPAGRLWVTRTRDGLTPGPIDIFDQTGEYRGTVEADGIPVAFPSDSTVVLLRHEQVDEPVLGLHALETRRE